MKQNLIIVFIHLMMIFTRNSSAFHIPIHLPDINIPKIHIPGTSIHLPKVHIPSCYDSCIAMCLLQEDRITCSLKCVAECHDKSIIDHRHHHEEDHHHDHNNNHSCAVVKCARFLNDTKKLMDCVKSCGTKKRKEDHPRKNSNNRGCVVVKCARFLNDTKKLIVCIKSCSPAITPVKSPTIRPHIGN
ncbi:hypothetical protein CASFOL_020362 [Castilleja foliolosa]|uniref:Uncharacterized protein n=1 Tax=Castilleja foliolosa TaxID=1961234 RepID=A0ABD3D4C9_9LAMI